MADPAPAAKTDDPPINTPFYLDKALWVTVLGPVVLWLNQRFGLALDPAIVAAVLVFLGGYVVAHKAKTTILQKATIAADATVAVAQANAVAVPPEGKP